MATPSQYTDHQTPVAHLLVAKYGKEILTTWIVFVHDNFLYYPYGASTEKHKDLQANSLMMWEAIKFGKKMECITFDLWGREEGKGFTRFKEGFNPKVVEFLGTWDLVINPTIYKIYRFAEKIRWSLLRLRTKFGLIKPSF
ncbi:MAG: FemAB family protein [Microgenomates group bacterium GW2011_GWC1_37_12b]|nr:MAG: FemAB family protein [Microgenomates group bacterium GW2011_GWC1_37_12b]